MNIKQNIPFEVIYAEEMDKNHLKQTLKILDDDAKDKKGFEPTKNFSFAIIDENKNLIAGVQGISLFGAVYIGLLAVNESFRGQGYATALMKKVEELAIENNSSFITLVTMDFQAKPFYEKLGYKLEFTRHGYAKNSVMYLLRKDL